LAEKWGQKNPRPIFLTSRFPAPPRLRRASRSLRPSVQNLSIQT
jgi:hypothetical protein